MSMKFGVDSYCDIDWNNDMCKNMINCKYLAIKHQFGNILQYPVFNAIFAPKVQYIAISYIQQHINGLQYVGNILHCQ